MIPVVIGPSLDDLQTLQRLPRRFLCSGITNGRGDKHWCGPFFCRQIIAHGDAAFVGLGQKFQIRAKIFVVIPAAKKTWFDAQIAGSEDILGPDAVKDSLSRILLRPHPDKAAGTVAGIAGNFRFIGNPTHWCAIAPSQMTREGFFLRRRPSHCGYPWTRKLIKQHPFCKFGYPPTAHYSPKVTYRLSAVCQSSAISISTADTSRRHDASLGNSRATRVRRLIS